jgi:hypothetical protein
MMSWPFGRKTLRPIAYPAAAGTWRASSGFTKVTAPATVPPELYRNPVSVPIGTAGQQSTPVLSDKTAVLQAGPAGVGASWALDQAGIATSVGAADTATCAIYAGPQASAPYLVAQSYAGGGDAIGLAGYTLLPGEFVWAVWSGGTPGSLAQLKVAGTQTVLTT